MKLYYLRESNDIENASELGKMLFPKVVWDRVSSKRGKAKERSALAYLFLRYCLIKEGKGECFDSVQFTAKGKPYTTGVEISLSHTAGMIACAVSETKVGVDVEQIRDIPGYAVKRFVDEEGIKRINNSIDGNLLAIEQWVIKESWLKQKGKGISVKLKSIRPERISDKLWRIGEDRIGLFHEGDYVLAIASEKGIPTKATQVAVRDVL